MRTLLATLVVCIGSGTIQAATWVSDYSQAQKAAREQDKPILVCFRTVQNKMTAPAPAQVRADLLDAFVVLYADRNADNGGELYRLFDVKGDFGTVVIERTQKWEFCRYERALGSNEMESLLRASAKANGKPASSVLSSVPAEQPTTFAAYVTPTAEGESPANSTAPAAQNYMPYVGGGCPNCRRF